MAWLEPVTLRSSQVSLVPLTQRYREELIEAVKDGELFKLWYTAVPSPEIMEQEIERRLGLQAAGAMLPFAVIDNVDLQNRAQHELLLRAERVQRSRQNGTLIGGAEGR